jgi:hypothetical protein
MLTAYSAVATDTIPTDAEIVFAYCNPPFAQIEAVRARLPHARISPIATHPDYMAEVYDFENGALNPPDAGNTIWRALLRGVHHPAVYFAISNHQEIVGSLERSHIVRSDVRLLPADYNPGAKVPAWADGLQRLKEIDGHQVNVYDLRDDFFHWRADLQPLQRQRF